MIPREVFERDRVLLQAERLRDFIDQVLSSRSRELRSSGRDILIDFENNRLEVTEQELVELRGDLDAALADAGYRGWGVRRRSAESDSFLPRNATLSQLQSVVANSLTLDAPAEIGWQAMLDRRPSELGGPEFEDEDELRQTLEPVTAITAKDRLDDALGEPRERLIT